MVRNCLSREQTPKETSLERQYAARKMRYRIAKNKANQHVDYGQKLRLPAVEDWVTCKSATLPRGVLHIRPLTITFCGVRPSDDLTYIDPARCLDPDDGRSWCPACSEVFHRERRKARRRKEEKAKCQMTTD